MERRACAHTRLHSGDRLASPLGAMSACIPAAEGTLMGRLDGAALATATFERTSEGMPKGLEEARESILSIFSKICRINLIIVCHFAVCSLT